MDTVRYFKLKNTGAFVARIKVEYKEKHVDSSGNVSYDAEWKGWNPSGYHDICASAERTVDLCNDAKLPEGAVVRLKAIVKLGSDQTSTDQYIYQKTSPNTAAYKIKGTTLNNSLERISFA